MTDRAAAAKGVQQYIAEQEARVAARQRYNIEKQEQRKAALRAEALADPLTGAADRLVAAWEAAQEERVQKADQKGVYSFEDHRTAMRAQTARLQAAADREARNRSKASQDRTQALAFHLWETMEGWENRPGPMQSIWRKLATAAIEHLKGKP